MADATLGEGPEPLEKLSKFFQAARYPVYVPYDEAKGLFRHRQ